MMNFRRTSVATAIVVFLTSFTPSQAFQVPVPVTKPAVATENVVPVQYREWDRRRHWDGRHMRRPPPHRNGWYNGHRGYRDRRPGYRYHNGYWFPLAAFAAGAIIGGAMQQPRPAYGGSHVAWCQNRWRSYRAYDNTYQPYNGPRRICVSPYSR
ncbi:MULTISPECIES: BA14K family protein [Agrobacterium]|uniref:Lectin-like protein BA14k n=1 Tax=Agrobacterium tumefaciens TaxID=358 RepID=A0AAF0GWJ2_AGRTU|nr:MULTISPECIES: BA14K family protein [Agrobacterium]TZG37694.1 BA14K family protein [Agrobacterium sp. B1(2019)]WGM59615.1 BA14K family protein [Agrobacterium tumefaciens]CVI59327.1 Putative lectin-like protein BAk14 [Agrobacterium salinitolerans str. Hayward 0363]